MDFIDGFDIELEKDHYYVGEKLRGCLYVSCINNVKIRGITVHLRGKVQVQWRKVENGAVYTLRSCHVLMDQKQVVWGKENEFELNVLKKGVHQIGFDFDIQEEELPCSFESKLGMIRYYLHATMDIPYASPPETIKYFTLIGQKADCPPQELLVPVILEKTNQTMCIACNPRPLSIEVSLSRTAFCCGENIPLHMEVRNSVSFKVWPVIQLIQKVDYLLDKTGLGLRKEATHTVWEYKGPPVPKRSTLKIDNLSQVLQIPVMPPTLSRLTCEIIQIGYRLKIALGSRKWGERLHLTIPLVITQYHSVENTKLLTTMRPAISTVEGGNYISPELQVGQVYDGTSDAHETMAYQPHYICVPHNRLIIRNDSAASAKSLSKAANINSAFRGKQVEGPVSTLSSI